MNRFKYVALLFGDFIMGLRLPFIVYKKDAMK